jgi:uncharacterized DUF497 family protein
MKDRANIRKQGIDFETAAQVFADPHWIVRHDRVVERESKENRVGGEQRCM